MKSDCLIFLEGNLDSVNALYPDMTKPNKLCQGGFAEHKWTSQRRLGADNCGSNMNSQPKAFYVEKSQHSGGQDDSFCNYCFLAPIVL